MKKIILTTAFLALIASLTFAYFNESNNFTAEIENKRNQISEKENLEKELIQDEISENLETEKETISENQNLEANLVSQNNSPNPEDEPDENENKIQLAILLDTSNSMDGLIEQTKSQLWKIVNQLNRLVKNGATPDLEIALFEYGNDWLSGREGYIRQVVPLTNDLDKISEKLFALKTNGGSEHCGQVIQKSLDQLIWENNPEVLKMIYIAGNEPFTQGPINYKSACGLAKEKNVIVNTIFCGNYDQGVKTFWQDCAFIGKGKYFNIDHNQKTIYVETPYDDKINVLNSKLNQTYISYGSLGLANKSRQQRQDANASSYSKANTTQRAISKSSKNYYNGSWDLVDAYANDTTIIQKADKKQLDKSLQNKSEAEIKAYVLKQKAERSKIQKEIKDLALQREKFIKENRTANAQENTLDKAIEKSLTVQAERKGFKINN